MNGVPTWLSSGRGGTPLVLLHGMGSTASVWLPQLDALGVERQVIAWNMPGYARSPALPALTWEGLAAALERMVEALGIERFHLLGHSIGGMIAQEYAARYPRRLASLILSASSSGFGNPDADWQREFVKLRTAPFDEGKSFAELSPGLLRKFTGPLIGDSERRLAELSALGVADRTYLDSLELLVTFDRRASLRELSMPVLLIAGELDTQAPPDVMERMAQRIANARYACLPSVSHMANVEVPQQYNDIINEFLRSTEPA